MIATDSFKGTLTADEAGRAIAEGIGRVPADIQFLFFSISDGGEGFTEAMLAARSGRRIGCPVVDALGRASEAQFGFVPGDRVAVLEVAQACGLASLEESERDAVETTSFGVGQLVRAALQEDAREIYIGVGGSATNDGGLGLLQALGFVLVNAAGQPIETPARGRHLEQVRKIDVRKADPRLAKARIVVACDVENPLTGPTGATHVYAAQKGAGDADIARLEEGMLNWADCVSQERRDAAPMASRAGAAGGIGFALASLVGGSLESGIDVVLEALGFDRHLENCDLVVTGEGRLDRQTSFGKAPLGVCRRAQIAGVPVIAIGGALGETAHELFAHGFDVLEPAVCRPMSAEEAYRNAPRLVADAAERAIRAVMVGQRLMR